MMSSWGGGRRVCSGCFGKGTRLVEICGASSCVDSRLVWAKFAEHRRARIVVSCGRKNCSAERISPFLVQGKQIVPKIESSII